MRWSSISLASLRASSTGWTWVRNARPKTPSKSASIFCSMFRSTVTAEGLPRGRFYPAPAARIRCLGRGRRGPPTAFSLSAKLARVSFRTVPIVRRSRLHLRTLAGHERQRDVDRPAAEHERKRARRRCGDERRGEHGAREHRDRQVGAADGERNERRGRSPGSAASSPSAGVPSSHCQTACRTASGCSLPAIPRDGDDSRRERHRRAVDRRYGAREQDRGTRLQRAPARNREPATRRAAPDPRRPTGPSSIPEQNSSPQRASPQLTANQRERTAA